MRTASGHPGAPNPAPPLPCREPGQGPRGGATLRLELSPPPAAPLGSRSQAHQRAPHPVPSLSFPWGWRSPRSHLSEAWQLQGPQPAQSAPSWQGIINHPPGHSHQGTTVAPFAPSPRCPILPSALCLHPPESGQQGAAMAEGWIQPRGAEGRGGRVLLTLSQLPRARVHPAQCCGSDGWELGFPDRLSSEGGHRGGLSGQCRAIGRAVEGLGVGEASRSGTNATGTDRGWAPAQCPATLEAVAPGPWGSQGLGGRQYGPDAALKFPTCSLLPPQRLSPSFLHPSLALWAARPGP